VIALVAAGCASVPNHGGMFAPGESGHRLTRALVQLQPTRLIREPARRAFEELFVRGCAARGVHVRFAAVAPRLTLDQPPSLEQQLAALAAHDLIVLGVADALEETAGRGMSGQLRVRVEDSTGGRIVWKGWLADLDLDQEGLFGPTPDLWAGRASRRVLSLLEDAGLVPAATEAELETEGVSSGVTMNPGADEGCESAPRDGSCARSVRSPDLNLPLRKVAVAHLNPIVDPPFELAFQRELSRRLTRGKIDTRFVVLRQAERADPALEAAKAELGAEAVLFVVHQDTLRRVGAATLIGYDVSLVELGSGRRVWRAELVSLFYGAALAEHIVRRLLLDGLVTEP